MKKTLSAVLLCMLLCALCASGAALDRSSLLVQDLYNYIGAYLSFDSIETNKEGMQLRKFSGNSDQYEAIDRYVSTLTSGSYNFKLVKKYFKDYGSDKFFSYALD